jgi:dihydrofolate reductase
MKPREVLDHLSKRGYSHVYVDDGKTIQSFLRDDLIDALIVTRVPVLVGEGIPLFGQLQHDVQFSHDATQTYPNGLVKSRYDRKTVEDLFLQTE